MPRAVFGVLQCSHLVNAIRINTAGVQDTDRQASKHSYEQSLNRIHRLALLPALPGSIFPFNAALSTTRMWANAQHDGRPAEYRWRPLFNAEKFG